MVADTETVTLLAPGEPPSFTVINPAGASPLVLVCDHAGNRVPKKLADLGLSPAELATHIAWDPGAALVARALSKELDAALVLSEYSRLVIDCNRPLESPQLVAELSAGTLIPGNRALSASERDSRIREVFQPYHDAVRDLLKQRTKPTALLSMHSFTPQLHDEPRPWHIGVAWYRDDRLARALFDALSANKGITVGLNQPYAVETEFDYTIPEHGEGRGLPSAMVEIRQDCITRTVEADRWARRLAEAWFETEPSLLS
jgi:predicted N-formylglutamate amidohydrolase